MAAALSATTGLPLVSAHSGTQCGQQDMEGHAKRFVGQGAWSSHLGTSLCPRLRQALHRHAGRAGPAWLRASSVSGASGEPHAVRPGRKTPRPAGLADGLGLPRAAARARPSMPVLLARLGEDLPPLCPVLLLHEYGQCLRAGTVPQGSAPAVLSRGSRAKVTLGLPGLGAAACWGSWLPASLAVHP